MKETRECIRKRSRTVKSSNSDLVNKIVRINSKTNTISRPAVRIDISKVIKGKMGIETRSN